MQIQYFGDLPEAMKGVEELGFSNLFSIQARPIIPLLYCGGK
jgi:superfamily II DNA/RNA helicase